MKKLTEELVRQMEMSQDGRDELAAGKKAKMHRSMDKHLSGFVFLGLVSLLIVPFILLPISLPLLGILAVMTRPKGATK